MIEERVQTVQQFQTDDWRHGVVDLVLKLRDGIIHPTQQIQLERILNRARSRGCLASLDDMIDFFRDSRNDTSEIFARIYKLAESGHITAQDFANVHAGYTTTIGGKVSSIK